MAKQKAQPITEMNYKLSSAVPYASHGEQVFSFNIKLKAPLGRHRAHLIRLKQGFMRSVLAAQKNAPERAENIAENNVEAEPYVISGADIIKLFYGSDIDLVKLQDEFRLLLAANIGEIAEGIPLNAYMIDQISQEDFEGIMGDYMAAFIVSSLI